MGDSPLVYWWRYWLRARQVLATEGLPALTGKIRRRLRTTPARTRARPVLPAIEFPYRRLTFETNTPPAVSIIVPVHNGYAHTYRCLSMLQSHAAKADFEIIVVDDASSDETADELARASGLKRLRNPSNLGFVDTC
ncbi:MAG: glycosyltransferase, partial [Gammaproteobacteria bacterium]|nr:glycosyltransferase [Gammaproteobacteria bacterium]